MALLPEVALEAACVGDQVHEALRKVGVQLINDEDPLRFWVGLDRPANVPYKILFRSSRAEGG